VDSSSTVDLYGRVVGELPAAASGAHEVSELVGWHPYLPPLPEAKRRREVVPGMTDEQILAQYQDRDCNPYLTMRTAKALYGLDLKCRLAIL
jgi:hypothetical protein